MRFMMMVKIDSRSEAGTVTDEKLLTEMSHFNEEMTKAGVMQGGEGLKPSSKGARVRLSGKKLTVVDGPFAEARELVGGFWLVQTPSLKDAIAWAKRVPFEDGEVEIRQLYELSDFPVDPNEAADGWREKERAFREAETGASGGGGAAAASPPAAPARKPGTTRFILMLKSDRLAESGALPTQAAMTEMGALMEGLVKSGAMLGGEGLKASSKGARVRYAADKRTVIDGPFTEAKEMIAGYTLVQLSSKGEAIELAKQWLKIHVATAPEPVDAAQIEIRPLMELEDFPVDAAEKPDGWRAREQRLRERLGQ